VGPFPKFAAIAFGNRKKHNLTISLVATRWGLDHECVGAVIDGARLGVSEHAEENLKVFGWFLNKEIQKLHIRPRRPCLPLMQCCTAG
jgi:aryl-alcohol dehydrogenase-like predicted oxidoreductase